MSKMTKTGKSIGHQVSARSNSNLLNRMASNQAPSAMFGHKGSNADQKTSGAESPMHREHKPTRHEIDAELYKEQFIAHFKKVITANNRKANDVGSFVT